MDVKELVGLTITEVEENDFGYVEISFEGGLKATVKVASISEGTEIVEKAEPKVKEKAGKAKEKDPEPEPEPEAEGYKVEDIKAMTRKEMKTLIKENELTTDPDDHDDTEALQNALIAELGLEDEAGEAAATEDDSTTLSEEDINGMDFEELKELVADHDLQVDPDDYTDNIKGFRKKLIKILDL